MALSPAVLVVLDGWGYRAETAHNAIAAAATPFFDYLTTHYPRTLLQAAEEHVGLPVGQIGNSEVGHLTIGAGTVIDTDLARINKAITENTLPENEALARLFFHVKKNNSTLHLQGLLGPGGIHSHQEHLYALIRAARAAGVEKIIIHAFTDGRDTPPQSAAKFLRELENFIAEFGDAHIGTVMGRYYAMDRDTNWERTARAEEALFSGVGTTVAGEIPSEVVTKLYLTGALDEHLEPLVFLDSAGNHPSIREHDGLLFFNFRSDRGRQLSQKILERAPKMDLCFVTLTEYDPELAALVAFPPARAATTLAFEIAKAGIRQTHIAETEKYAHATYFLNGGREIPHERENHILIDSRKDIATHDLAPEMRAKEITDRALAELERGVPFIFINYANADMAGHTANWEATLRAVETIDRELARLVPAVEQKGGVVFITADHGNAEILFDETNNSRHTAHTTNPVPAIVTLPSGLPAGRQGTLQAGGLRDVAPTILELLGLPVPKTMTGKNLLI